MATKTKDDLIRAIAADGGWTHVAAKVLVQRFLDQMIIELSKGHRLEFREFGVFEVRNRKARQCQNPKTLKPVAVPAKRTVRFKPGGRMKEALASRDNQQQVEPTPTTPTA
jgi:integration host factor subunit beta